MDELAKKFVADVEALAEPLLESEGLALIDVEYRSESNGRTLRLIIDKDAGVTLGDCTDISRQLGDMLDAKLVLPGSYHMEVSSPGLDRPLTKPKHFMHFKGRQVVIRTNSQVDEKSDFRGILNGFSDGTVMIAVEKQTFSIPFKNIVKARLDY